MCWDADQGRVAEVQSRQKTSDDTSDWRTASTLTDGCSVVDAQHRKTGRHGPCEMSSHRHCDIGVNVDPEIPNDGQRLAKYSRYQHEAETAAAADGDDGWLLTRESQSSPGLSAIDLNASTPRRHLYMQRCASEASATPTVDRNHKSVCHQRKDAAEDHGSRLAAAIQRCITRIGWVRGPTLEGHRTRLMTWRMLKNRFGRTDVGRAGRSRTNAAAVPPSR